MIKRPLFTSILAVLSTTYVVAKVDVSVPRLVVGITIDQLRSDYLEAFSPLYGEDGFKRLWREGAVINHVQYSAKYIDRASATASIYTGTSPFNHGIVGETWLDRTSLHSTYCVDDSRHHGINTLDASSPQYLRVSTLGDELKVATNGRSLVYSISPFREAAILSAGHSADWAIWLDDNNGQWAGTSYYGTAPAWISVLNTRESVRSTNRIIWNSSVSGEYNYNYYFATEQPSSFSHTLKGDRRFVLFKSSALVNQHVADAAEQMIRLSSIGRDEHTDLLAVGLYAGTYDNKSVAESAAELQDTYVRLDQAIANFLKTLDAQVGLKNTLVFVTSTGYENVGIQEYDKYKIPTGRFQTHRCAALLNMYLSAIYGQGQYVESYFYNQFYLNRRFIEEKHLRLSDITASCEDFLYQYAGVRDVYTSMKLTHLSANGALLKVRNSFHPAYSGDIIVDVSPGWDIENETSERIIPVRDSFFDFPLFFFGFTLEPQIINTPITTDRIAPTVAHHIRIRAPNACNEQPIPQI